MELREIKRAYRRFPVINTDRLILRKIDEDDTEDMFEYSCSESTTRYLLWSPHESMWDTYDYIKSLRYKYRRFEFFDWAIEYREEEKMIGTVGLFNFSLTDNSAEVGYVINSDYKNRGIATEALRAALAFGFDVLGLHRIEAQYMTPNLASRRVMEKCGMVFEGVHRDMLYVRGEYRDIGVCAAIKN